MNTRKLPTAKPGKKLPMLKPQLSTMDHRTVKLMKALKLSKGDVRD